MKLHRFLAKDAPAGLAQIRRDLGPDAVVVTSRRTGDGIEFLAGRYGELAQAPAEQPRSSPLPEREEGGLIRSELVKLRALLQNQLAGLAWGMEKRRHPVRVRVLQKMLAAGFSPRLARHLAARMPGGLSATQAEAWLRQVLVRNLSVLDKDSRPGIRPGIWALVGPTGHGKTTTLAKLAAGAVQAHGRENVALLSIDTYRIGAQPQLQAYAGMLGVDAILLDDVQALPGALARLAGTRCVLIDAAGFNHDDPRLAAQLEVLGRARAACLLTLAASTQGGLANQILLRYRGLPLAGAVLTKLDEGGQWAPVLDCLMRARLPVACVASGQRVPEDLHAANPAYLVDRALRAVGQDEFAIRGEDWPLLAGAAAEADELHQAGGR